MALDGTRSGPKKYQQTVRGNVLTGLSTRADEEEKRREATNNLRFHLQRSRCQSERGISPAFDVAEINFEIVASHDRNDYGNRAVEAAARFGAAWNAARVWT